MAEERANSLPPRYFDDVYAASDDPWQFATSDYERAKYTDTLAHLPRRHYANALEVGCSIGVLTAQLAERCDRLLAVDVSEQALNTARNRCADLPEVHFERLQIPNEEPRGAFDLILVSEVGYYWGDEDLDRAIDLFARHQPTRGDLVLVHWTPFVHDYPLTGDAVHDRWLRRPEWRTRSDEHRERYRVSVLERTAI